MDAPPAELFRRNPTAFQLWVELQDKPRPDLTPADAQRLTGATQAAARSALAELVTLGVLERARPGHYIPADRHRAKSQPVLQRLCRHCTKPLAGKRQLFCSDDCSATYKRRRASLALAETRSEAVKWCAICGTKFGVQPRSWHQLYCSTKCAKIADRRHTFEKAIKDGSAGSCEACQAPTPPGHRWCSRDCTPRARGGKGTVSPQP